MVLKVGWNGLGMDGSPGGKVIDKVLNFSMG